jgi:predicted ATPase/DNA-binding CsgD family transcriptional regulator
MAWTQLTGNLPAEVNAFVGREMLLAEGAQRLQRARLVTLTGVGGVGKTRLALRLAADVGVGYRDGVWLVDLAPLDDPDLLDRTVAEALGIVDNSSEPGLTTLITNLRDKQLLLVLDNCEHLVEPVARLVHTLLRAARELRVLITSRRRLKVAGEHLMEVPPLRVSRSAHDLHLPEGHPPQEALQLLIDRAAAVGFTITALNMDLAVELCRLLDGLPLAIELAAVRLGELTITEILDQLRGCPADERRINALDNRFELLTDGDQYDQHYHATLHYTLDWSYRLCTQAEQQLWAQLSVFSGGFDLAAVQAVCTQDVAPHRVLDLLTLLARQSILITANRNGRTRYRMLETIRQFGAQVLQTQDEAAAAALQQLHADFYRSRVDRARGDWCSPRELTWMEWLRQERDNLRVAMDHYLHSPGQMLCALEMATALASIRFWFFTGLLGEGRVWLHRALDACPAASPLQVAALAQEAWTTLCQGDPEAATTLLQRAHHAVLDLDGDAAAAARAPLLFAAGTHALLADIDERSIALLAESREAFRRLGNPGGTYMATLLLSFATGFLGSADAAQEASLRCLADAEAHQAEYCISWGLWARGLAELVHGCPRVATQLFQQALRRQRDMGDTWGPAWSLWGLACAASKVGDHERAARLFGGAHRQQQVTGAALRGLKPFHQVHEPAEKHTRVVLGGEEFSVNVALGHALPYAETVEYALEEPSTTPEPEPDEATDDQGGLTEREFQIAELIATGLTSKEIAENLFISPRTVDRHVQNTLDKLGFSRRAQIAAWVTSLPPAPSPRAEVDAAGSRAAAPPAGSAGRS